MTLAVAVLMKDPSEAKTRLRPALGNDARERLALVLFENTLDFFQRFHPDAHLAIVTPSERIAAIAWTRGIAVLKEPGGNINAAAFEAVDWARTLDAASLLVIHADIPTLADTEVARLLEAGGSHAVVVGESHDGGSNAVLLSPPGVIPFHFGPGSAAAHGRAALAGGHTFIRLRLPHLGQDLDTPADLAVMSNPALVSRTEAPGMRAFAVEGLPEVAVGDDLAALIADALVGCGLRLRPFDIVVLAQKVVSKSEGRMVPLSAFKPSSEAERLAESIGKDPRKVEAILSESIGVVRARRQKPDGLLITRHRHGWVCANAAIDESNLGPGHEGMLLLLPDDPDASARRIRQGLEDRFGGPIGVVVTDTFGRPWRQGLVNVAIGAAGVPAVVDWTSRTDAYGRGLKATLPAFADELAAAAGLLMQKDSGRPAVVVRGLDWDDHPDASARDVLRPVSEELFL